MWRNRPDNARQKFGLSIPENQNAAPSISFDDGIIAQSAATRGKIMGSMPNLTDS